MLLTEKMWSLPEGSGKVGLDSVRLLGTSRAGETQLSDIIEHMRRGKVVKLVCSHLLL